MKMKNLAIICFLLILFSCKQGNRSATDIISIDPRIFPEVEISLAEIADDISYIPLDNQFPIGIIYSYKIINDFIYAAIKDVGVVRFTNTGKLDKKFGKIGLGPGEYVYCLRFAVDEKSGTVYVMDHNISDIEVYNNQGKHIRNLTLPVDKEGFKFSDIEYFNKSLVVAQYINMGHGDYNWIVLDTLGNRITEKANPYTIFNGRMGGVGGLQKYNEFIVYWDQSKDTVFHISADSNYNPVCIFSPGEHRLPMTTEGCNPPMAFINKMGDDYLLANSFLETKNFFIYNYTFHKNQNLALINKMKREIKSLTLTKENGGITNNIDNGLAFTPETYILQNKEEYLISRIQPFELKAHLQSDAFKTSTPLFPEKKKALEQLANSLNENDNPVLMLVKLKD